MHRCRGSDVRAARAATELRGASSIRSPASARADRSVAALRILPRQPCTARLGEQRGCRPAVHERDRQIRTDAQISEGVGDTLRERLMGLPGISVQARASSLSFDGRNADPRTTARDLGVAVLINGTLRKTRQDARSGRRDARRQGLRDSAAAHVRAAQSKTCRRSSSRSRRRSARCSYRRHAHRSPPPLRRRRRKAESANKLVLFGNHYVTTRSGTATFTIDEKNARQSDRLLQASYPVLTPTRSSRTAGWLRRYVYKGDIEALGSAVGRPQAQRVDRPERGIRGAVGCLLHDVLIYLLQHASARTPKTLTARRSH